ncbi:MAG: hypothetical protein M3Y50_00770, partial [Acidobacteriota bacterium]|nr:hypothetical protein [Acidobacteriota bacterium]
MNIIVPKAQTARFQPWYSVITTAVLSCFLIGCGSSTPAAMTPAPPPANPPPTNPPPTNPPPTNPPPPANPGTGFSGKAMAGKQPLVGASVQLYAAGISGTGSAASALLSSPETTDDKGGFTIASGYSCPAVSSQLYLLVRGGQVGTTAANLAITFATPVGPCNQVNSSASFVVNEVTTAATVWGLTQFLSAGGNVGASSTN